MEAYSRNGAPTLTTHLRSRGNGVACERKGAFLQSCGPASGRVVACSGENLADGMSCATKRTRNYRMLAKRRNELQYSCTKRACYKLQFRASGAAGIAQSVFRDFCCGPDWQYWQYWQQCAEQSTSVPSMRTQEAFSLKSAPSSASTAT